jgi:stage V sporulation protein B
MGLIKKSLELSAAGAASAGFIYAYRILSARTFGQEEYGLLSLMLAITNIMVLVFMSAVPPAIAKFVAEREKAKETYRSALWLFPRIGVLLGVLLVLATPLLEAAFGLEGLFLYLALIAISFPITMVLAVDRGWMQGTENIREFGVSQALEQALKFGFLAGSIYLGYRTGGALLAGLLGTVVAAIYARRLIKIGPGKTNGIKPIMDYFIPISMTRMIDGFVMNLDTILLKLWVSLEVIGIYNAASPLARIPMIAFAAVSTIVLPDVSGDKTHVRAKVRSALKFTVLLILPGIIVLGAYPSFFIRLFFGAGYEEGAQALRLLLASSFFIGLYKIFSSALQGIGKPYTAAWIFVLVLAFDVYGMIGAAAANLASGIMAAGLAGYMLAKTSR